MNLLAHIVHRRRQTNHAEAAQLRQYAKRQLRSPGDDRGVRSLGMGHPGGQRQRPAIRAPHDIVGLVM